MAMFDPAPTISETLLHFADPLLPDLSIEEPERKAPQALNVSFTVWNAVVFADVLKDHYLYRRDSTRHDRQA